MAGGGGDLPAGVRQAAVTRATSKRRSEAVLARFGRAPSPVVAALLAAAPIGLPTLVLAYLSITAITDRLGHPGAALDDSFIHFQYARAIADGHPFRYEAGEPHTMGATSALWPLLLAPFYLIGLKGLLILWPAWVISFAALGLLAREVMLLAKPLAGWHAAVAAGAMVLAFSPFTWCAGSGMEVVPFAFVLTRAVRRSSEWCEGAASPPSSKRSWLRAELLLLAFAAPLLRPEGALASLVVAAALLFFPSASPSIPARRARLVGVVAVVAALSPQLLSWIVTGQLRSNTALVKLLPGNPYYVGPALWSMIRENVHTLLHVLMNGEVWSAEFLPHASMPVAFAGLAGVVWCAWRKPLRFRAASIIALAVAAPCAYVSFLWNRLRYLWPFAPFWIVGVACLARAAGDILARGRPRWRVATPIFAGLAAGLFATKLEGTIDDLAMSASGIDRQQVALGLWAKDAIPAGARIGVNDTGAIAYFSDHPTFDVCGLTTPHEGRYWVAGAASRFEHYERLMATSPESLPQYFIVYPEWMAMSPVLGTRLHDATVTDSTILGGQTMVAYEADYSLLGSGERAWSLPAGSTPEPLDSLDVADLDSEQAHGYELLGAPDGEEILTRDTAPDGTTVVDGGRRERERERFHVRLDSEHTSRGVVRLEATELTRVVVRVDGEEGASFLVEPGGWKEVAFPLPHARPEATIELAPESGKLTTYHYWFTKASPG